MSSHGIRPESMQESLETEYEAAAHTGILRYMWEPCCPVTRHHASAHGGPPYTQGYLEYQELEPLMQTSTFSGRGLPDAVMRCPHGVWREMGIWKASEQHMAHNTFTASWVASPGIFISNSMGNCRGR